MQVRRGMRVFHGRCIIEISDRVKRKLKRLVCLSIYDTPKKGGRLKLHPCSTKGSADRGVAAREVRELALQGREGRLLIRALQSLLVGERLNELGAGQARMSRTVYRRKGLCQQSPSERPCQSLQTACVSVSRKQ